MTDLSVVDLAWAAWMARPSDPGCCRVCGGELAIGQMGGGHPTIYHCATDAARFLDGRKSPTEQAIAQQHFRESRVEVTRHGDPDVRAMVAEIRRRRADAGEPSVPEVGEYHNPFDLEPKPGDVLWRYVGDDVFELAEVPG